MLFQALVFRRRLIPIIWEHEIKEITLMMKEGWPQSFYDQNTNIWFLPIILRGPSNFDSKALTEIAKEPSTREISKVFCCSLLFCSVASWQIQPIIWSKPASSTCPENWRPQLQGSLLLCGCEKLRDKVSIKILYCDMVFSVHDVFLFQNVSPLLLD